MKKLLSVSILAMLAVAPLAANATEAYSDATIYNSGDNNDTTKVATTAYVKGAYNAANTNINAERVRVDNINTTIGSKTEGTHNILYGTGANVDNTIYGNLEKLETAIGNAGTNSSVTGEGHHYIGDALPANTENTVANNLVALDNQVYANTTDIGTKSDLGATASTNTNLTNSKTSLVVAVNELDKDMGKVSTLGSAAGTNISNNNTLVGAIGNLDTKLGTVSKQTMGSTGDSVTTIVGAIAELNGGDTVAGSVSKKIKDNAASATYSNTTSGLNATTIQDAIDAIDATVDTLSSGATVDDDGTYIRAANNVAANLGALDTQVATNTGNISTNAGDITTINNTIGTETMGTTATTLKGAIAEVNSKVLTVYSSWNSGGAASGDQTVALSVPTQQGSGTVGG